MLIHTYLLRRVFLAIPTVFGISLIVFIIANALPADPVSSFLPNSALGNQTIIDQFRRKWGLDRPLHEQYISWITNVIQGDFGISLRSKRPVSQDIGGFLPATIELATVAIVISLSVGVTLGVISAVWRGQPVDYLARILALIGVSFPVFVLALIGKRLFAVEVDWLPSGRRLDLLLRAPSTVTGFYTVDSLLAGNWRVFQNAVSHLVLPSIVLAVFPMGFITRLTRSAMLESLGQDYMRTARSKGLRESIVIFSHGLRNALIPVVTIIGLSYSSLLAGAVLTESIFSWPGIGRYAFLSATSQDFPATMGVTMLIALIYVGVNFTVDILYFFVDPRIRAA